MDLWRLIAVATAVGLAWMLVGAVLVLRGHHGEHWWDPSWRRTRSSRPKLSALGDLCVVLAIGLMLPWSADVLAPAPIWRIGLGMVMWFAAVGVAIAAIWTRPGDLPPARWAPDPTGESDLEWFWDGGKWTDRRRVAR